MGQANTCLEIQAQRMSKTKTHINTDFEIQTDAWTSKHPRRHTGTEIERDNNAYTRRFRHTNRQTQTLGQANTCLDTQAKTVRETKTHTNT